MTTSDDIATIALVTSLVALIISGLQLLQQLFGTSEGWSRCGPLVIGRWSRLRRSHWLWTEMRYETKFTTPNILLLHNALLLDCDTRLPRLFPEKEDRAHWWSQRWFSARHRDREHSILKFQDSSSHYEMKSTTWSTMKDDRVIIKRQLNRIAVTWPELIHHLARYYYLQIANMSPVDGEKTAHQGPRLHIQEQRMKVLTSVVGIQLEEHSWDSMPPDVVRPMAIVSLRDLIIIGIRLGLRWRRISLFDGLQATGAMGSISSTMVPGLGTIAMFNFTLRDLSVPEFRLLAPSQAADKLMCGIIPATPNLGICSRDGKDMPLVDDNRSLKPLRGFLLYDTINSSRWLSSGVGKPENLHEVLIRSVEEHNEPESIEWWARAAVFDTWCMLSPFVPVERSCIVDVILPMPGDGMRTPLNYQGGRQILCLLFRKRFQPRDAARDNADWVQVLLDGFEALDRKFVHVNTVFKITDAPMNEIVQRVARLRQIHDATSKLLVDRRISVPAFVGAHIMVASNACQLAQSNWNSDLNKVDDKVVIDRSVPRDLINKNRMHFLAYCYEQEARNWEKYARDCDMDLVDSLGNDADLLWWTLVLRAMCWALSVRVNLNGGTIPYEPVPSSLYGDPTPIWIM